LVVTLSAAAASAAAHSPSSLASRASCSGRTTHRIRYAHPRAASAATSAASSTAASSSCWRLVLEEMEPWLEHRISVAEARAREEEVEAGLPLHPRGSALLLFLCHRHRRSSTSACCVQLPLLSLVPRSASLLYWACTPLLCLVLRCPGTRRSCKSPPGPPCHGVPLPLHARPLACVPLHFHLLTHGS